MASEQPRQSYGLPSIQLLNREAPLPGSLASNVTSMSPGDSTLRPTSDDREPQGASARLPSILHVISAAEAAPQSNGAPTTHHLNSHASTLSPTVPPYYAPSVPSSPLQQSRGFGGLPSASRGLASGYNRPRSPFAISATGRAPSPPMSHARSSHAARPVFDDSSAASGHRSTYPTPHPSTKLPALQPIATSSSPTTARHGPSFPPFASHQTPSYDASASARADPSRPHYAHGSYSPKHLTTSPTSQMPPSAYSTHTATYPAPPRGAPLWSESRVEEKKLGRAALAPYGESVKRHLESFDLEASLNEMAEGSGRIGEFSKLYSQRAHEHQRVGMTLHSIPRLEEVDEMLKHSERITLSLHRMRDVVYSHHQARLAESAQEARYGQSSSFDDSASNYGDDTKSGGYGNDSKRPRKGRAAPPGRCHSCNRAETPEWRRGPDGARTLCNACGLHYAKLTRKMGGKQAMSGSNLRQKPLEHGSPPA